jgi:RimJ/RimL family protein N-acetyltransferase
VEQVLAEAPTCAVDVVLGPQAKSLRHLRELAATKPHVTIHVDTNRMAELMRDADLAIGAAGSTSWERCCLGLPAIVFAMAENQRLAAENLERAGAIVLASSAEAAGGHLRTLLSDEPSIASLVAAAAALVDGRGSERVVQAMGGRASAAESLLTLRAAAPEDSRLVWLWRNDFVTRQSSQKSAPIPWPDHATWWERTRESADRELLIAEAAHEPVAALRFDRLQEGGFEVSINVAPTARHAGLGARALAEACEAFRQQHGDVPLFATIHHANVASRQIFEKLGFRRAGALSDSGFESYVSRKEPVA